MEIKKVIVQKNRGKCFICGAPHVEEHHIFFGTSDREISDRYGLVCDLCAYHHREGRESAHKNAVVATALKQFAQACFEEVNGHDAFMDLFKRNYLDDNYCNNYFFKREVESSFFNDELAEDIMGDYETRDDDKPYTRCGEMNETKCPICGKLFYPSSVSEWAYHENGGKQRIVCSYHCSRTFVPKRKFGKRNYVTKMERAKRDLEEQK